MFNTLICREDENGYNHGCNVLTELVDPWANTGRTVVADSYFASTQSAVRLWQLGFRFIGIVKTATKGYPMQHLGRVELPGNRGDRRGLISVDSTTGCQLLAFVWCDRDRRYFISTCSSLADGSIIDRMRWRQVDQTDNADPERVHIVVAQPKACEIYCSGCSSVDRHNRSRQAGLNVEKKLKVLQWQKRINTSIFAMVGPVDAWFLYKGISSGACMTGVSHYINERSFFEALIEQLIDNTFNSSSPSTRKRSTDAELLLRAQEDPLSVPSQSQLIGITPTKRFKKNNSNHRMQGRCLVCQRPATTVCRECQRMQPMAKHQHWICDKPGKACMGKHMLAAHPSMVATPPKVFDCEN